MWSFVKLLIIKVLQSLNIELVKLYSPFAMIRDSEVFSHRDRSESVHVRNRSKCVHTEAIASVLMHAQQRKCFQSHHKCEHKHFHVNLTSL